MLRSLIFRKAQISRYTQLYPPLNARKPPCSSIPTESVSYASTTTSRQSKSSSSAQSPILRRRLKLPTKRPRDLNKNLWKLVKTLGITFIGEPALLEEASKGMPKAGYYAVASGHKPGIYTTWAEAELQVKGYPGAKYKKFPSASQAEEYITSLKPGSSSTTSASTSTSSFKPYDKPFKSGSIIASTSSSSSIPEPFDTHFRAESPTTTSSSSTLPSELQEIASKGYEFTKEPYYLIVHTDGSALGNGKVGSRAGAGVCWGIKGEAASKNYSERVPGLPQTNNRGELLAVIRALEQCPYPELPLEIRCDSQYSIQCMTTWLPKWLNTDFHTSSSNYFRKPSKNGLMSITNNESKQVMNVDMIKHLLVLLRRRSGKGKVKFKYVPAHTGIQGNEKADELAKLGSMMPENNVPVKWLDPDKEQLNQTKKNNDNDNNSNNNSIDMTDIEVDIDESWLMSAEELESFEKDLIEE